MNNDETQKLRLPDELKDTSSEANFELSESKSSQNNRSSEAHGGVNNNSSQQGNNNKMTVTNNSGVSVSDILLLLKDLELGKREHS